jgi:hypothetical protein
MCLDFIEHCICVRTPCVLSLSAPKQLPCPLKAMHPSCMIQSAVVPSEAHREVPLVQVALGALDLQVSLQGKS